MSNSIMAVMRAALAVLWGVVGVVLFLRTSLLPDEWLDKLDQYTPLQLNLIAGFGIAACGWNIFRLVMTARRRPQPDRPSALEVDRPQPYEYNPDLDVASQEPPR